MKYEEQEPLDAEEATLMLYLAGELSPAETQAFETRLASDTAMKSLAMSFGDVNAMLHADATAASVTALESRRALTSSLQLVREQALVLQSRSAMRIRRPRLASVPKWGWATAAAACLAIGFVFWANNSDPIVITPSKNTNQFAQEGQPELRGIGAAFAAIEPEGSQDATGELDNQLDALNVLATMNEMN